MEQAHLQNRWLDTPAQDWTPSLVHELSRGMSDHAWLVEAALVTRAEDGEAQLAILQAGLDGTTAVAAEKSPSYRNEDAGDGLQQDAQAKEGPGPRSVAGQARRRLLELQDRTKTWQEMYADAGDADDDDGTADRPQHEGTTPGADEGDDEDPEASWAFDDSSDGDGEDSSSDKGLRPAASHAAAVKTAMSGPEPGQRPPLPLFLSTPLPDAALHLASTADFTRLHTLFRRHSAALSSHRLHILDCVPLFSDLDAYLSLLPQVDGATGEERLQTGEPWRDDDEEDAASSVAPTPASAETISHWYRRRIDLIDSQTGQIDSALLLVQHGASQSVPGLDALGEELSLLSKLVYDRPAPLSQADDIGNDWTLARWRTASEQEIVAAYLAASTPVSIPDDIRRLVLPYLYVLESRKERAGSPDPILHDRLLYEWLLGASTQHGRAGNGRLDLAVAIFEQSKPTLKHARRLIKDDLDLARLALAIVYAFPGTASQDWQDMTALFDCLPALDQDQSQQIVEETTSDSAQTLFAALCPSAASTSAASAPTTPNAHVLYSTLSTFSTASLSCALDAFDLHLEAAEIFSRWSSPRPLYFFVSLSQDAKLQRAWADRLAKTSAGAVAGRGGGLGADFEYEDEWISLLDDLCKLSGAGDGNASLADRDAGPVFGSLSKEEITRIFFAGLLSSGKFDLAKSLFSPSSGERPLDANTQQELVLAASREFYDNAESGNLHSGNMKLAFDCLSVAPQTAEIRRERDFIEATSRLASYRLRNAAGEPLAPIEVRLASDKLALIARLLASPENADSYRHPELILELASKLGYRGDSLAETRVLSMLADAALAAGDARRAAEACDRMVAVVQQVRKGRDREKADSAADLAWKTCFQIGGASAASRDLAAEEKRKELLGQALLLCPPGSMNEVLAVWQIADNQHPGLRSPTKSPHQRRASRQEASTSSNASKASVGGLGIPFHMPSRPSTPSASQLSHSAESAARAALSVGRAASAYLPFRSATPDFSFSGSSVSRSASPGNPVSPKRDRQAVEARPPSRDQLHGGVAAGGGLRNEVSDRLQKGFTSGIGWLIGADEH